MTGVRSLTGDTENKKNMRLFIYGKEGILPGEFPIHDYCARAKSVLSALVIREMDRRLGTFISGLADEKNQDRAAYFFFTEPSHIFAEFAVMAPQKKGVLGTGDLNVFLRDTADLWFTRFTADMKNAVPKDIYDTFKKADSKTRGNKCLILTNVAMAEENYFWNVRLGDRLMCVKNDYVNMIFNGECGTVVGINTGTGTFRVQYPGRGTICGYTSEDKICGASMPSREYLIPAYAMTIHKSQGSEYESVCLVISPEHTSILSKNLLYTGVSRARTALTVITDARSWEEGIMRIEDRKDPYSGALAELITHHVGKAAGQSSHIPRQA